MAKKIKKDLNSNSKIIKVKVPKNLEEFQVIKRCGNSSKLFKLINYKPNTSFSIGIKKTLILNGIHH